MDQRKSANPAAFDQVAADYDSTFSTTKLGRMLRSRVWKYFEEHFQNGVQVLDLACGTGEDALWLAQLGIHVTALDGSPEMVRQASEKTNRLDHLGDIVVRQCSLEEMMQKPRSILEWKAGQDSPLPVSDSPGRDPSRTVLYDGAISNFGGLNVTSAWSKLARALAIMVRSGGKVILVPMGPFCPWEIGWSLIHGNPRTAFRRFGRMTHGIIGNSEIPIWYPSSGQLKKDFQPWFKPLSTTSLGLLLPPTNLTHLVERWPRIFNILNSVEEKIERISFGWGDHFILILERNELNLES